jgi:hypothetical protein
VDFIPFEKGFVHFNSFGPLVKNKKCVKARHLIWLTTTLSIRRLRNNILSSVVDRLFIFSDFGL